MSTTPHIVSATHLEKVAELPLWEGDASQMDLTCQALAAVMEMQTTNELEKLREVAPRMQEALNVTRKAAAHMADKFGDLVWYTRCNAVDASHPGYERRQSLKQKYPEETAELDEGSQHGFNRGVLATARLMSELATIEPIEDEDDPMDVDEALEMRREVALESFPELDT